jgi:ketosteroid isomerase-like protein
MTDRDDVLAIMQEWMDATDARDAARLAGLFVETQHPKDGSNGRAIHGRAIYLLRRHADGGWLIEHGVSHRRARDTPLG